MLTSCVGANIHGVIATFDQDAALSALDIEFVVDVLERPGG
jgi:hypothetical protein